MWVYVTAFASTVYKKICKTISFLHFKINLENNLFYNKYLRQFFPCTETWEHEVPNVIPRPEYKTSWRGLNNAFFFSHFNNLLLERRMVQILKTLLWEKMFPKLMPHMLNVSATVVATMCLTLKDAIWKATCISLAFHFNLTRQRKSISVPNDCIPHFKNAR